MQTPKEQYKVFVWKKYQHHGGAIITFTLLTINC